MSKQPTPKLPKATHEGTITINNIQIDSYNLENGDRVLSRAGVLKAIGRTGKAKGGRGYDEEFKTPVFLTAQNLQGFISSELMANSTPVHFTGMNGSTSIGYKAQLLPSICYVFMDAQEAGMLKPNQVHIAEQCKILVRGFATVGIIALVDEATGFQYERERDELQEILKLYINEALLPWQRRFPNLYYREIFRLNGWDFSLSEITRRRPGVVGTWTNQFVYEQLPKDVLKTLKEKTPKNEAGQYTAKFHQSLTEDIGHPGLQSQISAIVALMQISDTMEGFKVQFEKLKQRRAGQLEFQMPDKPNVSKQPPKPRAPKPSLFDIELKGLLNVPPNKDKPGENKESNEKESKPKNPNPKK